MNVQRNKAKQASQFKSIGQNAPKLDQATEFLGYEQSTADSSVSAIFDVDGKPVDSIAAGDSGMLVLATTAFYVYSWKPEPMYLSGGFLDFPLKMAGLAS